jgi:nucleotide-binding universal stress UspA family protein
LEAVFGDQAIRRLAETAKDDLDGRVQALLSVELLRYHKVLDALRIDPDQAEALRDAAAAVELARESGLPVSETEQAGLPAGEQRLAIDAPTVTQIPSLEAADDSDIVDAELIEQPREELR